MSVRINFEIGHEASLRTKRTQEGFTHDWEVFVRGCDGADISNFVEKVVFYLHETFPKPRRVFKEPPYSLKESGYAGFNLPIDIYLKNKDEPKKIKFNYDLSLQTSGPPVHKLQKERYIFKDPGDEFKHRLIKGGGMVVSSSSSNESETKLNSDTKQQLLNKPKLGGSIEPKKHKSKIEDSKESWTFNSLFGLPIKRTKTPEPKLPSKDPVKKDKEKEKLIDKERKNKSPVKDRDKEKRDKDERKKEKSKERSKEHERSNKDKKRDKSPKRSPSPTSRRPSPKRSEVRVSPKRPPSPPEMKISKEEKRKDKDKEKDKEKDDKKYKKRDKDKDYEAKHKDKDYKSKDPKLTSISREKEASPMPPLPPPPTIKPEKKEKLKELVPPKPDVKDSIESNDKPKLEEKKDKHKHKKKDKDRDKEKDKEKRDKSSHKSKVDKKYDPGLFSSPKHEKKKFPPMEVENDNSNSSASSTKDIEPPVVYKPPSPPPPAPVVAPPPPSTEPKVDTASMLQKPKKDKSKKKEKKLEKEEKKRKRRSDLSPDDDEPDAKVAKEDLDLSTSRPVDVEESGQENPEDYMRILQELQHKIMSLQDNTELQKVVKLIAETGRYEVSARTFDFDLCLLERSTVRRLQEFFSVSS